MNTTKGGPMAGSLGSYESKRAAENAMRAIAAELGAEYDLFSNEYRYQRNGRTRSLSLRVAEPPKGNKGWWEIIVEEEWP